MSTAGILRLQQAFIDTPVMDMFRTTLGNDPPADVEPVKVEFKPEIYSIVQGQRRYSPSKSAFMHEYLEMLTAFGCVRPNPYSPIASPAHPV